MPTILLSYFLSRVHYRRSPFLLSVEFALWKGRLQVEIANLLSYHRLLQYLGLSNCWSTAGRQPLLFDCILRESVNDSDSLARKPRIFTLTRAVYARYLLASPHCSATCNVYTAAWGRQVTMQACVGVHAVLLRARCIASSDRNDNGHCARSPRRRQLKFMF